MSFAFKHRPVLNLQDVTANDEQLEVLLAEQEAKLSALELARGAAKTEPWKGAEALGFKNSWKNLEAARKAEYRKDLFGTVFLRGLLASGESGKEAFKLPAGYAPKDEKAYIVDAAGSTGIVNVFATGEVRPSNLGGEVKTFVFLDPVFFSTE